MRVLVVDDDRPTLFVCRRVLERLRPDLEIEEASDASGAMRMIRSQRFDGVLSDYRLGAASGLDVLALAREQQPKAFRALMTGFADPTLQAAARQQGVHAFIEKPMTSEEFHAVLRDRFLRPLMAATAPREG